MPYIVQTASYRQPGSRKWQHRRARVAILEIDPGAHPKMISARARGVRSVVDCWDDLFVGKTDKCQFKRVLARATARCAELNQAKNT